MQHPTASWGRACPDSALLACPGLPEDQDMQRVISPAVVPKLFACPGLPEDKDMQRVISPARQLDYGLHVLVLRKTNTQHHPCNKRAAISGVGLKRHNVRNCKARIVITNHMTTMCDRAWNANM